MRSKKRSRRKSRRNPKRRSERQVLAFLFIISIVVAFFALNYVLPASEYLKVVDCSGGKTCDLSSYGITGYAAKPTSQRKAHTIGKSQTGTVVMSDTIRNREIDSVYLQFRYFGKKDISGNWLIELKNDALTETYCVYLMALSEHMNYAEIDITDCGWTTTSLDDLTVQLTNEDTGAGSDAFVNFLKLKVVYKEFGG